MQSTDTKGRLPNAANDTFCPFIKSPRPECYCVDMNNRKINLAMRFCMRDYQTCRIYEKIALQKGMAVLGREEPRRNF